MVLIGLGNPGIKYSSARHNAGKILAAYLGQHPVEGLESVETDCFMNESGAFVRQIVHNTRVKKWEVGSEMLDDEVGSGKSHISLRSEATPASNFSLHTSKQPSFPKLIIAHDDLDLKLGEWKFQFARGPRLHKGILSIEQALKTKNFWRLRIGVDNRATSREPRANGEEYVLRPFSRQERLSLVKTFGPIKSALKKYVTKNVRSDINSDKNF